MKRIARHCVGVAMLAVGSVAAPVTWAVDEGACGCWYAGYDDGFEYAWKDRKQAEAYQACARRGQARHYEDGMKKAAERASRRCPVGK